MDNQTTYIPDNYTSCGNRLPCGVCLLTNKPCPRGFTKLEPTCIHSSTTPIAGFNFQTDEKENKNEQK